MVRTERLEIRVALKIKVTDDSKDMADVLSDILANMDYEFTSEDAEIESEILEQI